MAGYSRTNTADIQSGQVVKSAPINAELNAIVTAFAFSGGHNHDGSSTEGGKRQRHKDFTNADYPKNFKVKAQTDSRGTRCIMPLRTLVGILHSVLRLSI